MILHIIPLRFTLAIMFWPVLIFMCSPLFAQYAGLPMAHKYDKTEYHSGSSNWAIAQDNRGIMYFANNNGLLFFDGFNWVTHRLPNKTATRSVALDNKGRIYVGGQNEIGYFYPNEMGALQYHSILEAIPEAHRRFTDVWQIDTLQRLVYWRSQEKIYIYDGNSVRVINNYPFQFAATWLGSMLLQSTDGSLYNFDGDQMRTIDPEGYLKGTLITEFVDQDNGQGLLVTEQNGVWQIDADGLRPWNEALNEQLKGELIYSGVSLSNGRIALGTTYSGMIILDRNGKLQNRLHREAGVKINQIICMYEDRAGNLWAGLNNGIAIVNIRSPFSFYYPESELEGVGYQSIVYRGDLYFATSNGLYYKSLNQTNGDFQLIPGTQGQAWGLDIVDDHLILSHNNGAYIIKDHNARRFFDICGVWLVRPHLAYPDQWLLGTYNGLYTVGTGGTRQALRLSDLSESSRFVVQQQNGDIWMAHPYRGIYRVSEKIKDKWEYQYYNDQHGLPSQLHNHVFSVLDTLLFCGERGIYTYDRVLDTFNLDSSWIELFDPNVKVRRLVETPDGDIWFITETELGYFEIREKGLDRKLHKRVFPQIYPMLNGGWEHIYPYDKRNVFIATAGGFVHFDPGMASADTPEFQLILREVIVGNKFDRKVYGGFFTEKIPSDDNRKEDNQLRLPFYDNSILFQVAATEYKNSASLQFRWRLLGLEQQFSTWSDLRFKEYNQLQPGSYVLQVECHDATGHIRRLSFRFVIETSWYQSLAFQILIVISLISGLGWYVLRSQKKLGEMEEMVEETVKESQKKEKFMEQQRMITELDHKRRELVSSTLHLANMQDNLSEIKDRLKRVQPHIVNPKARDELNSLLRKMDMNDHLDDHWEDIMLHFNEIHGDLLQRLKREFPSLSGKDLRLCTYLRMNLSTKEIASLMNVSTRGVEASRYRIRKKLGLSPDTQLIEFLIKY